MEGYKTAWEESDERKLTALFAEDGVYHNTPFAEQRGHAAIAAYWQRTKLQSDIRVSYEILSRQCRRRHRALARHLPGHVRGAVPDLGGVHRHQCARAQAG